MLVSSICPPAVPCMAKSSFGLGSHNKKHPTSTRKKSCTVDLRICYSVGLWFSKIYHCNQESVFFPAKVFCVQRRKFVGSDTGWLLWTIFSFTVLMPIFKKLGFQPPWFETFLHHGIDKVERHLLWKFHKKIQRKSWSNVPPNLLLA